VEKDYFGFLFQVLKNVLLIQIKHVLEDFFSLRLLAHYMLRLQGIKEEKMYLPGQRGVEPGWSGVVEKCIDRFTMVFWNF
jgi:hypothetical protein